MKRKRLWILLLSCIVCVLLALGLYGFSAYLKSQLPHEQVAKIWDKTGDTAQISVFFSEGDKHNFQESLEYTSYQVQSWYYQILEELKAASITNQTENPTARLVVNGYSAAGEIRLESEYGNSTVKAYGVGGDFFQFHSLKLLYGSYFSENDLMQDHVILDTDTAWQLFGSNNVVGQFVLINKVPHMVVGVYERESGYFNDAAGNNKSCIYVSHETLYKYGQYHGLESVEYLIPNPVSGFAKDLVEKQCSGMDVAIVEHQKRFDFLSLIGILGQFGTRSMGRSSIVFPYWENMARGYEDILAGLLFVELVLLAYSIVVIVGILWYLWLHRKWRVGQIYQKVKDFIYAMSVKQHKRKLQKKNDEKGGSAK